MIKADAMGGSSVTLTMMGGALSNNGSGGLEARGGTWTFTNVVVSQNGMGIYVQGGSATTLGALNMRGCTITNNRGNGIKLFDFAAADLGTAASPGNNLLQGNTGIDLDISGYSGGRLITAVGNTWNPLNRALMTQASSRRH